MEYLALQEFEALMERYEYRLLVEDTMHARTRQGLTGGRVDDYLIFRKDRAILLDPSGKPIGMPFDKVAAQMGLVIPD